MDELNNKLSDALEEIDLQGWLEQYVDTKSGGGYERRLQTCPKCLNDEYKLYVNCSDKVWVCYVCDWGRYLKDATVLMSAVSGRTLFDVRKEVLQAVKPAPSGDLTEKLMGVFFKPQELKPEKELLEIALPGADSFNGLTSQKVYNYAIGRGLTHDEVVQYRLRASLKLRGYKGPFCVTPVYYEGRAVNWQGRRVEGDFEPKYVSYDDISNWLWPIDDLFIAHIRATGRAVLVEGTYDAAGMWRVGMPGLATFGKKISDAQIELLRRFGVREVWVAWDADAARTSDKKLHTALGAKKKVGMRGEIETAALRLRRHFTSKVVDLSDPPEFHLPDGSLIKKPDPGEILRVPEIADWVNTRLNSAMDVNSAEFFQWQLS